MVTSKGIADPSAGLAFHAKFAVQPLYLSAENLFKQTHGTAEMAAHAFPAHADCLGSMSCRAARLSQEFKVSVMSSATSWSSLMLRVRSCSQLNLLHGTFRPARVLLS